MKFSNWTVICLLASLPLLPIGQADKLKQAFATGGPRNFFEEWQRYSNEDKKLLYAAIHRGRFGNDAPIDDTSIDEVTQAFKSFAAYPTLQPYVHYAQDGGAKALQKALDRGATLLEIDAVVDLTGHLVFSHSAHAKRQTLINQPWSKVDAQALSQEQRRMIAREFKDGRWTERYVPLDDHVLVEKEFIDLWLSNQSGTTALLDLKGKAGKFGIMFVKRYPEYAERIVPMIYNTEFPGGAQQLKTEVAELGGTLLGKDPLALTTNPSAFQTMAQLGSDAFDSELVARRQIEWVEDNIKQLNIYTVVLVLNPDWEYYNPTKHIVEKHPTYGTITDPKDVRRFEVFWVGEKIRSHLHKHHPNVAIGAPSNRPVLIDDNVPYVDHFITGEAVRIDPGTINAYLFEKGGRAHFLKEAGAHYVITEDPDDVTGTEVSPYQVSDYAPRNYPGALAGVKDSDWFIDENYE